MDHGARDTDSASESFCLLPVKEGHLSGIRLAEGALKSRSGVRGVWPLPEKWDHHSAVGATLGAHLGSQTGLEGGPMGAFPRGIHFMVCHHLGEARQMHPDKANLSSSSGSWLGADLSVT